MRGLEGAQGKEGSRWSLQDSAGKWGEQAAPGGNEDEDPFLSELLLS